MHSLLTQVMAGIFALHLAIGSVLKFDVMNSIVFGFQENCQQGCAKTFVRLSGTGGNLVRTCKPLRYNLSVRQAHFQ